MVSLISNRNEKLSFKIILCENQIADENMNMPAGICHQNTKTDRLSIKTVTDFKGLLAGQLRIFWIYFPVFYWEKYPKHLTVAVIKIAYNW